MPFIFDVVFGLGGWADLAGKFFFGGGGGGGGSFVCLCFFVFYFLSVLPFHVKNVLHGTKQAR